MTVRKLAIPRTYRLAEDDGVQIDLLKARLELVALPVFAPAQVAADPRKGSMSVGFIADVLPGDSDSEVKLDVALGLELPTPGDLTVVLGHDGPRLSFVALIYASVLAEAKA